MSYERAQAEAVGKARELRKTAYEIADIVALKYNLTNTQRLRLREQIAVYLISSNHGS